MQVNQNVNAANLLLVGNVTNRSLPSQEELSPGVGFADILSKTNQQSNNYQSTSEDCTVDMNSSDVTDNVDVDHTSGNRNAESKKTSDDYQIAGKSEIERQAQKETVAEPVDKVSKEIEQEVESDKNLTDSMLVPEGFDNLTEDELQAAFEAIGDLLVDVMQQFDLTIEELGAKLQEFGMVPADLFTKDGLKEFFLNMNQVDASQLLVDETLGNQLQDFMMNVTEELQQLQTIIDDVNALISNDEFDLLLTQALSLNKDDIADVQSDEPLIIVDNEEPEVIVDIETKSVSKDSVSEESTTEQSNQQSDQQSNQQMDETIAEDETSLTQKTTAKNTSFNNPILQAIQNAVNQVEQTVLSEQPIRQADIVRQVVEQVRLNMNQQQTSLELQLYPEHLGRIQINVVSKEGVMTASIVAETEAAKQAIESGLLNLKETMEQQELKVEAIEVMVSTMGFDAKSEQQDSFHEQSGTKARRKIDLNDLSEEVLEDEVVEIEKMKATGSSVSYLA